jgi:hypothetical protein
MVVGSLLQPERAARLIDQNRRDPKLPGLGEVIDALVDRCFRDGATSAPRLALIGAAMRRAAADGLLDLAANPRAEATVRAIAEQRLAALARRLAVPGKGDRNLQAYDAAIAGDIRRWLDRRSGETPARSRAADPPPGSPIGSGSGIPLPPTLAGCDGGA